MKRIIFTMLLILCNLTFSKSYDRAGSKTMRVVAYEISENKELIDSFKNKESKYEMLNRKETEDFVEMRFVVNGKVLHYTIYKDYITYERDLKKFLEDRFFTHISNEKFKNGYRILVLDPIITSKTYGKWYALIGNKQIIKASGDDFASASENIQEFYNEVESKKTNIMTRVSRIDWSKLIEKIKIGKI